MRSRVGAGCVEAAVRGLSTRGAVDPCRIRMGSSRLTARVVAANFARLGIRIQQRDGAARIPVRAQPRASRTEIAGEYDGALKVRIAAPPVDGAANEELARFLAKTFGVSKSMVRVVSGESGRDKLVEVAGVTATEVAEALRG